MFHILLLLHLLLSPLLITRSLQPSTELPLLTHRHTTESIQQLQEQCPLVPGTRCNLETAQAVIYLLLGETGELQEEVPRGRRGGAVEKTDCRDELSEVFLDVDEVVIVERLVTQLAGCFQGT